MNIDFEFGWHQIKNGDERALERVYKSSFGSLVKYARDLTGHHHLGEEVVQDVFMKIWQNRSELNIKGSFRAYLFQSVHNQALNVIRQKKTKKESVNIIASESIWQFITDNYRIDDNLIERIFSADTEAIIKNVIEQLPDQCNRVFQMSRFESLKNDEIAIRLGVSENTVKSHIYRALRKIASALKSEN